MAGDKADTLQARGPATAAGGRRRVPSAAALFLAALGIVAIGTSATAIAPLGQTPAPGPETFPPALIAVLILGSLSLAGLAAGVVVLRRRLSRAVDDSYRLESLFAVLDE